MRPRVACWSALVLASCGASPEPGPESPKPEASEAAGEASVSTTVRTRLPKDTPCETADVCGYFLQVISPGAEPEQIAERAVEIVRGKCAGSIIVYRDKRGVLGAGPVFATEEEKQRCMTTLGRGPETDDYPSAAVWRKAE